jgi:hypothetical protein
MNLAETSQLGPHHIDPTQTMTSQAKTRRKKMTTWKDAFYPPDMNIGIHIGIK